MVEKILEVISHEWGTLGGHDPSVIKDQTSDTYYMFSTDTMLDNQNTSGVQIRRSKNLENWEYIGNALDGVPKDAKDWANAIGLWAPEVIFHNGEYRMYYSASTFGSTISCIGLAVSGNLEGPWEDRGIVVKTSPDLAMHNAIDANVFFDKEGKMWMSYGSFFGGIYLVELAPETGKRINELDYGEKIAYRPKSVDTAIEGCFILYKPEFDYYYMFVSHDSLFDTYNIRVLRSRNVKGPYEDFNGKTYFDESDNPDEVGLKILGSYQFDNELPWIGPGHNSVLKDHNDYYLVHHVRIQDRDVSNLTFIRTLNWLSNGWPVAGVSYFKDGMGSINEITECDGLWEIVVFEPSDNTIQRSELINIDANFNAAKKAELENIDDYIMNKGWDWVNNREQLEFTGIKCDGRVFIGRKK